MKIIELDGVRTRATTTTKTSTIIITNNGRTSIMHPKDPKDRVVYPPSDARPTTGFIFPYSYN